MVDMDVVAAAMAAINAMGMDTGAINAIDAFAAVLKRALTPQM